MKIMVKVHPNSKNPRIEEKSDGNLEIYVREVAKENKANKTVVKELSNFYNIPKSDIMLIHGIKSRYKVFEINI